MPDPSIDNGARLFHVLHETLNAEQALPPQSEPLVALEKVVTELRETLAEAHHHATALALKTATDLGALRTRFDDLHPNFLRHVRQRAICGNRSVLGFCGGFSAGKSTFLNVLVNQREDYPLPTKPTRDTALPVFLLSSGNERLWIENHQGRGFLQGQLQDLELFRHSERTSFEPWAYLVRSLYFFAPWIDHSDVAYLDLPGHTAGPDDLRVSLAAARQCDAIVYLIDVSQGDLTDTDVEFLRALSDVHPPFLIMLTKCDQRPPGKLAQIQAKIAATLQEQEIPHEGPYQWSKDPTLPSQHRGGIKAVREYGAKLARGTKDKRFNEIAEIAAQLAGICAANVHHLKQRTGEMLDEFKEVAGTSLPESVFRKAKEIATASRSVGSFVESGIFGKSFSSDEFGAYHYSRINQWSETSQQSHPGNLNYLAIQGLYATLKDGIDQSRWWATLHQASPSTESDKWYYEHLNRIATSYRAVVAQVEEIAGRYKRANERRIEVARALSSRAEDLKRHLAQAYWSLKTTTAGAT